LTAMSCVSRNFRASASIRFLMSALTESRIPGNVIYDHFTFTYPVFRIWWDTTNSYYLFF
jgi:hypothetical protein